MTTLLLLLTLLVQAEDAEQLKTSVEIKPPSGKEAQIAITCDFYPKTLTVGEILYVQLDMKNISREPFEYFYFRSSRYFLQDAEKTAVQRRGERLDGKGFSSAAHGHISFFPPDDPMIPYNKHTLQPGGTITIKFLPCFVPSAGESGIPTSAWNAPILTWNDVSEERVLIFSFDFGTSSTPISKDEPPVQISQELKFKQRPKEELQLIKEWSEKTNNFSSRLVFFNNRMTEYFTVAQWREFEEKLTPGTLRNYIRVNRTIVEIAQDENKGKRQELFNEMLKWFDTLHPLEKEGLTKRAYEIVEKHYDPAGLRRDCFDHEIVLPVAAEYFEHTIAQ